MYLQTRFECRRGRFLPPSSCSINQVLGPGGNVLGFLIIDSHDHARMSLCTNSDAGPRWSTWQPQCKQTKKNRQIAASFLPRRTKIRASRFPEFFPIVLFLCLLTWQFPRFPKIWACPKCFYFGVFTHCLTLNLLFMAITHINIGWKLNGNINK